MGNVFFDYPAQNTIFNTITSKKVGPTDSVSAGDFISLEDSSIRDIYSAAHYDAVRTIPINDTYCFICRRDGDDYSYSDLSVVNMFTGNSIYTANYTSSSGIYGYYFAQFDGTVSGNNVFYLDQTSNTRKIVCVPFSLSGTSFSFGSSHSYNVASTQIYSTSTILSKLLIPLSATKLLLISRNVIDEGGSASYQDLRISLYTNSSSAITYIKTTDITLSSNSLSDLKYYVKDSSHALVMLTNSSNSTAQFFYITVNSSNNITVAQTSAPASFGARIRYTKSDGTYSAINSFIDHPYWIPVSSTRIDVMSGARYITITLTSESSITAANHGYLTFPFNEYIINYARFDIIGVSPNFFVIVDDDHYLYLIQHNNYANFTDHNYIKLKSPLYIESNYGEINGTGCDDNNGWITAENNEKVSVLGWTCFIEDFTDVMYWRSGYKYISIPLTIKKSNYHIIGIALQDGNSGDTIQTYTIK